jgi:hypothetical protein
MTEIQQKQLAFLQDMCGHFTSENRGLMADKIQCSYVAGCAIGRKIESLEIKNKLDNWNGVEGNSVSIDDEAAFHLLPPHLYELGSSFLKCCQVLHDNKQYWDSNGLSDQGQKYAKAIMIAHNLELCAKNESL